MQNSEENRNWLLAIDMHMRSRRTFESVASGNDSICFDLFNQTHIQKFIEREKKLKRNVTKSAFLDLSRSRGINKIHLIATRLKNRNFLFLFPSQQNREFQSLNVSIQTKFVTQTLKLIKSLIWIFYLTTRLMTRMISMTSTPSFNYVSKDLRLWTSAKKLSPLRLQNSPSITNFRSLTLPKTRF